MLPGEDAEIFVAALAALPFLAIMLVDLTLVSLVPNVSLFLPHLLYGYPLQ